MAWIIGISIFLLLLFAFPKQMGVLFLVIFGGGAAAYFIAHENQERDRRDVTITAFGNKAVCPDEKHPIAVTFENMTKSRTLNRVSFSLKGYRSGYSSSVIDVSYLSSDRIIPPGQRYLSCWSLASYNHLPEGETVESLRWEVEKLSADWK